MVVVRAAQLWEEGGGYTSCLTSMGSSGALRAQWEVGSPAQSVQAGIHLFASEM